MTASLSACLRTWGKKSDTGRPLLPPGRNGRNEGVRNPILRPPELMNFLSAGSGWPACLSSKGLGSKVSTWLGPPFMSRKMQLLAFPAVCGALALPGALPELARAWGVKKPSRLSRSTMARPANPAPICHTCSLRVRPQGNETGLMASPVSQ